MSLRNIFIRSKEDEPQVSTMETILGKKVLRLCPLCFFLIIFSSGISNPRVSFPLKGLLFVVTSSTAFILGFLIIYKIIEFKIHKAHNRK